MTDDDVYTAVETLVRNEPDRGVTAGEVAECVAESDVAEVSIHLEQLRQAGRLFRAVGTELDHPPAVVAYTPYQ